MSPTSQDRCLICNEEIDQLHNKLASCRACAVFFRRSIKTGHRYICKTGTKKCDLKNHSKEKHLCRYCRFQRCKEVGMKRLRHRSKLQSNSSEPSTSQNPMPVINSPPSTTSSLTSKIFFDMQPLEDQIKQIFNQKFPSTRLAPGVRLSFLQQLCYHFPSFLQKIQPKSAVIVTNSLDLVLHLKFQEKFMSELTQLFMKCDQFSELAIEDKWLLFKNSWLTFYKLERFYTSIQIFGTSFNECKNLFEENLATDYLNPNLTINDMSLEKCEKLWGPIRDRYIKCIINPMKTIQMTQFELIYMLAQILWSIRGLDGLTQKTERMAEEILYQASNELHDYYVNDKHLSNYASRLTEIHKIIAEMKAVLSAKKDMTLCAKVFNIWELEVTGTVLGETL